MLILCAHTIYSVRFITVHYFVSCFKRIIETRNDLLPCRHGIFRDLREYDERQKICTLIRVPHSPRSNTYRHWKHIPKFFLAYREKMLRYIRPFSYAVCYVIFKVRSACTLREMRMVREAYPPPRTSEKYLLTQESRTQNAHDITCLHIILPMPYNDQIIPCG